MKLFLRILKISFSVLGWLLLILLLFPVRVDLLCRFRTAAEQKKTLKDFERGTVDIIIGTHRVLRYIFFRFRLSPREKHENREKKEEKEKEKEKEKEDSGPSSPESDNSIPDSHSDPASSAEEKKQENKEKKKEEGATLSETIEKIRRLVSPLLRPGYWLFRMLLKAVRVRDVSVVVSVTGSDPASIGFRSGIHWSLMNTLNYLFGKNVTYGDVTVYPCFDDSEPPKERMSCTVSVQPLIVILLVIGFLLGYLFELVKNLLNRGGKKNVK